MSDFLEVIPLGGLGEFGMNCTAVRYGEEFFLIDCGLAFPRGDQGFELGIQVIVPDFTFVRANRGRLRGVVLTHGHEDHTGAISYLLQDLQDLVVPVYGSSLTLALVAERLQEKRLLSRVQLHEVAARRMIDFGPLQVEPLHVTHSYPDSFCLVIHSPSGRIVWSGDFKFDQTPIDGKVSDLHRLAAYGEDGVLALFSDSTNSLNPGLAPSEFLVYEPLRDIFRRSTRRVIASTFASSIHRIQIFFQLAREFDRLVCPVGRSMMTNIRIARELGYLQVPDGAILSSSEAADLPPEKTLILASGSQGEPMSALSRLAVDQLKDLKVEDGDTVILSTRIIPGNEMSIARLVNHLYRRGARVYDSSHSLVHVSGHGYRDDLKLLINLVKPKFFVPIHGEYRQLKTHYWIAQDQGIPEDRCVLAESGDVLRIGPNEASVVGRVQVGRRFIDEGAMEQVHEEVLRDRRFLAEDGFVVVILQIDRYTGRLIHPPEILSRGFMQMEEEDLGNGLLCATREKIVEIVQNTPIEEKQDEELFNEILRKELRKFLRKRTGKRPLVLTLVIEV